MWCHSIDIICVCFFLCSSVRISIYQIVMLIGASFEASYYCPICFFLIFSCQAWALMIEHSVKASVRFTLLIHFNQQLHVLLEFPISMSYVIKTSFHSKWTDSMSVTVSKRVVCFWSSNNVKRKCHCTDTLKDFNV